MAGADTKTQSVFTSSSLSRNGVVFNNCNPPSIGHFVDKKIVLSARVHIMFTGTSTTGNLLKKGRDGLRYLPLHSIIDVARCSINNVDVSCDIYNTLHARSNYWRTDVDQLSRTKSFSAIKDNCQNYSDVFMTTNSPLSGFGDSGLTSGQGRGAISNLEIRSNTATGAELVFTISEELIIAPFAHDTNEATGSLWNINTLSFNLSFISNLNRIWCHDDAGGSIITSMNTDIETMELQMTFITPPPPGLFTIPPICTTTFTRFNLWTQDVGIFNPNEEKLVSSQVLQLNNVPQSIYLFAKVNNNLLLSMNGLAGTSAPVITYPDSYCQLGAVNFTYNNVPHLLGNSRIEQLYDICVSNGYNRDYLNFRGIVNATMDSGTEIGLAGTVYRFIFGKDIAIPDMTPGLGGMDGRSNFQVFINVKNINQTTPLPITLYILTMSEGVIQIVNGSAYITDAPINTVEEVHNAPNAGISYNAYKEMIGGGFWDTVKGLGKMGAQIGLNALASNTDNPLLKTVAAVGSNIIGGRRGGAVRAGSIHAGGQSITTKQLRMIKDKRF